MAVCNIYRGPCAKLIKCVHYSSENDSKPGHTCSFWEFLVPQIECPLGGSHKKVVMFTLCW